MRLAELLLELIDASCVMGVACRKGVDADLEERLEREVRKNTCLVRVVEI